MQATPHTRQGTEDRLEGVQTSLKHPLFKFAPQVLSPEMRAGRGLEIEETKNGCKVEKVAQVWPRRGLIAVCVVMAATACPVGPKRIKARIRRSALSKGSFLQSNTLAR